MNLFLNNIRLSIDLARRDLEAKYKRSLLSWLWIVLTPLCLLGIYSFVFGVVLKVEWRSPLGGGAVGFVLPFFIGLSVYLLVTDVVNSSVSIFVSKRTFVVKSPFPIWVLWLANLMRATVHGSITFVLVLLLAIFQHTLTLHGVVWMVLAFINLVIALCAVSLLLSAIGPFIGDISEALRLLMRVLFYATPITYPISYVKPAIQDLLWLNPLTNLIEPLRSAIVFGELISVTRLLAFFSISVLLLILSIWVFRRLKGAIPDVV